MPTTLVNPMRIALISEHASPLAPLGTVDAGGQNIYVANVARMLARQGHEVDVFTRRDDPGQAAAVDMQPGVRVIHLWAGPPQAVAKERLLPLIPAFSRSLERLMTRSVPHDIVHANFFMSGMAAMRLKRALGLPFVMTFHALGRVRREHQGAADGFPDARITIEQRLVREADAVVAECPQDRLDLMRLYDADPARIATVPCGVDPDEFRPMERLRARQCVGVGADEFVILQLGRMVPRKGVDNVVRALALLPKSMRARLLVVGGESAQGDEIATPEIGRLRALARECGVAEHVRFTGHRQRKDLRAYYAAADAFVSTPWYEPFGITPLEAMACGTPVVGSRVGGVQYSVEDGVTGFLVPPKDPAALAAQLVRLHDNPALTRALGRAGVRRVRSLFTWERVAHELSQLYDQVRVRHARTAATPWPTLGLVRGTGAAPVRAVRLSSMGVLR